MSDNLQGLTFEKVVYLLKPLLVSGELLENVVCDALRLFGALPQHMLQERAVMRTHTASPACVCSYL